jgi:hypothetical protein
LTFESFLGSTLSRLFADLKTRNWRRESFSGVVALTMTGEPLRRAKSRLDESEVCCDIAKGIL